VVARHQNIPQAQLKSGSRRQSIVFARGLIVYLARELAEASYEEIGRALGGRDHTTIIHNYRKIAAERTTLPQTQKTLETLQRILLSR
jgi:chromosomal replication initiator protein